MLWKGCLKKRRRLKMVNNKGLPVKLWTSCQNRDRVICHHPHSDTSANTRVPTSVFIVHVHVF